MYHEKRPPSLLGFWRDLDPETDGRFFVLERIEGWHSGIPATIIEFFVVDARRFMSLGAGRKSLFLYQKDGII